VNRDWAAANRDVLLRFLRGFLRAHDWFHADRDGAGRVAMLQTGISGRYADLAWDEHVRDAIFPQDGAASEVAVQTLIETSGLIRDLPRRRLTHAADYIDHSWLDAARASLAGDTR
jgi:ABC-type nitrate/sulfonate/bicarbonate transport system substrate-binding protein